MLTENILSFALVSTRSPQLSVICMEDATILPSERSWVVLATALRHNFYFKSSLFLHLAGWQVFAVDLLATTAIRRRVFWVQHTVCDWFHRATVRNLHWPTSQEIHVSIANDGCITSSMVDNFHTMYTQCHVRNLKSSAWRAWSVLCVVYLASAKYKRNASLMLQGGLLDRKGS